MDGNDSFEEDPAAACCPCLMRGKCKSCICKKSGRGCRATCPNPTCHYKQNASTSTASAPTASTSTAAAPPTASTSAATSRAEASSSGAGPSRPPPGNPARQHPYAHNSARNTRQPNQHSRNEVMQARVQPAQQNEREIAALNDQRIDELAAEDCRIILRQASQRDPRALQSILQPAQRPYARVMTGPPPSFCVCGQCIAMEDRRMCVCCRHADLCITFHPTFHNLCLRPDVIEIANIENWSARFNEEPSLAPSTFRNQAYRNFILWHFGKLGRGNRRVPLSCVVARIRWMYPDANNIYTGYQSFSDLDNSDHE